MRKRPKRTAKQTYILQVIWGVLLISLVVGLGYGIWHVTRLPGQTINSIEVSGGVTIPDEEVIELVEIGLEGTYAGLIPRTFKYLYPKHSITKLVDTIPKIKELSVYREGQTIKVEFSEYIPYALWCYEEHCLIVDDHGYAFMESPGLSGGSLLRFVVEGSVLLVDQVMLPEEMLRRTVELSELLDVNFGFKVIRVTVDESGDVFYDLVGGSSLRTSSDLTNQETLENLSTILESEEFKHLEPDNFQYIDLRFGNRVYVNEEIAVPVSTSTATSSEEQTTDSVVSG